MDVNMLATYGRVIARIENGDASLRSVYAFHGDFE